MERRFKKLYVEITNVCNLACAFCPPHGRAPRFMSRAEFSRVLGELAPYGGHLYLHVKGEPLLHPQAGDFIRLAASGGFPVNLTTNGVLLQKHAGIFTHLRQINLSLHATGDMELVRWLRRREDAPPVSLRLWGGAGSAALAEELEREFEVSVQFDIKRQKLTERIFLSVSPPFEWPDISAPRLSARGFCLGLRDQIAVLADGTAVPCCLDHRGEVALGNIFRESARDILASRRAGALYDGFSRRRAVEPLCAGCSYKTRFDTPSFSEEAER